MIRIPEDNPDPRELDIHPRRRLTLRGHEQAELSLRQSYASGRMHHAFIIGGPRGIGKATLAYRFARFVLRYPDISKLPPEEQGLAVSGDHPVARQIAANSHPDLFVLQRAYDDKLKRLKTEIAVDDARKAEKLFERKAASGGYRVCIIDAADEFNASSANSILKTLEEPPAQSLFLIVNHAAGTLLPTIRSRCIRLNLQPLATPEVEDVLLDLAAGSDQDLGERLDPESLRQAAAIAGGSPGRGLELAGSIGAEAFSAFLQLAPKLPHMDMRGLFEIADKLSGKALDSDFRLFFELLEDWIANQARMAGAENHVNAHGWAQAHQDIAYSLRLTNSLNLDKRQTVIEAFTKLQKACGG